MRNSLFEGISKAFIEWAVDRASESDIVKKFLLSYASGYVMAVTGFSMADWTSCRVKAVKIV